MNTNTSYNFDFLNSYFTSNEFNFINNANLENQKLDETILKETQTRDIIVTFINHLNDYISDNKNSHTSNKEFLGLLSEVQEIFEKINTNIKIIQALKNDSSKLLDDIVNLLINIEQNKDNTSNYDNQIQELKKRINNFSVKHKDVKSKILLNDIKIDTFFQKNFVKKYLSDFDVKIHLPNNNSSFEITDNTNSSKKNPEELSVTKESNYSNEDETITENSILIVSEKLKKVFLPYTKHEIFLYLDQYPDSYLSFQDVIEKEFVLSLDYYMKHPVVARFREAYSLIRDREAKSVIDAFKFAIDIMFRYELNPVIIAACKTEEQLENYLNCLKKNKLEDFKDFEIRFEVSPLGV